ncbi:hypothetical protein BC567DRAFT_237951 [Phyllosticta citribraziliensis]
MRLPPTILSAPGWQSSWATDPQIISSRTGARQLQHRPESTPVAIKVFGTAATGVWYIGHGSALADDPGLSGIAKGQFRDATEGIIAPHIPYRLVMYMYLCSLHMRIGRQAVGWVNKHCCACGRQPALTICSQPSVIHSGLAAILESDFFPHSFEVVSVV